jgi:hypothetical protein
VVGQEIKPRRTLAQSLLCERFRFDKSVGRFARAIEFNFANVIKNPLRATRRDWPHDVKDVDLCWPPQLSLMVQGASWKGGVGTMRLTQGDVLHEPCFVKLTRSRHET